jgi:ubiquinone/menaquinone biosynthesis C-methylase UbiE
VFSELFKHNILVKLLRGDTSRYDLMVSMVSAKLGERLLQVHGGDGALLAALGGPTGLTGTIAAVEPDETRASRVMDEATKAGVLADVTTAAGTFPYQPSSFDIVVIPFPADEHTGLAAQVAESFRVLRDGGRCVIITRGAAGESSGTPAVITALQQQGFRAARVLAERSGLRFYEALKK